MLLAFATLAATSVPKCVPVELVVAPKSMPATFGPKLMRRASGNFAKAYAKACGQGLVKGHELPRKLFLHNAPDANVASLYRTGKIMVLEYPFVSGGKANVPSADELHEAIFCAVHGASPKEQEESGRCLPD